MFRLLLTALHYNENADREQAKDKEGKPAFCVRFPKYKKGGFSVTPIKKRPTYGTIAIRGSWSCLWQFLD